MTFDPKAATLVSGRADMWDRQQKYRCNKCGLGFEVPGEHVDDTDDTVEGCPYCDSVDITVNR